MKMNTPSNGKEESPKEGPTRLSPTKVFALQQQFGLRLDRENVMEAEYFVVPTKEGDLHIPLREKVPCGEESFIPIKDRLEALTRSTVDADSKKP